MKDTERDQRFIEQSEWLIRHIISRPFAYLDAKKTFDGAKYVYTSRQDRRYVELLVEHHIYMLMLFLGLSTMDPHGPFVFSQARKNFLQFKGLDGNYLFSDEECSDKFQAVMKEWTAYATLYCSKEALAQKSLYALQIQSHKLDEKDKAALTTGLNNLDFLGERKPQSIWSWLASFWRT